ncbi:anaerobic ribonucleoside-triphosphate reductase, partial [Caldisericum sp.]|uniref:anaerobic ribonucleoside-triphosphate reductase n=1 Tax=Caldisericum sp. TaxID=2499687 RepID=UPI003D10D030
HFSSIGIIGMNEALQMLFDRSVHMGTQKGIQFAVDVMLHIREKLKQFQEDTGHLFNLEATPSESTSYSLAVKDKKIYPDIVTAGTEENPYYTNSTQLPVDYTDDPFELAELQEPVQRLYTGGTVIHFFLGERLYNPNSAKIFVKKILENFEIPYITITPSFSICPKHGYIAGEHEFCPLCDEELKEKAKRGELENNKNSVKINVDLKIDI